MLLAREPDNQHDPEAVRVYTEQGKELGAAAGCAGVCCAGVSLLWGD